ncbi:MAG TPA: SpoIID/LytB domain-containing protein [Solirubrobacteraceae bacterium]|jgi:SpoIID/LytB domain protein|nr:SpoIID/LytB domain-containing protein [Solirubrobacteraceae bacterium]
MDLSSIECDRGSATVLLRKAMCSLYAIRRRTVASTPRCSRAAQLAAGGARRASGALLGVFVGLALWSAPAVASTLLVEGAGDGHGVGMSQDGALGYAQHGWSDTAILTHYYTGTTLGQAPANSVVKVLEGAKVVRVPLERYVRGVVSAEMPSNWPLAALEAQAIASRTYALTSDAGGARFDVYSDTRSQVYESPPTPTAETATTNTAVAATAGQIVEYGGKPAITYYFASSGGMTEDVQNAFLGSSPEPWLQGVPDSYETKSSNWTLSISFASAAARLSGLVKGNFRGIEVLKRGISPRIITAEVLGSHGNNPVSGPELAARLGLTSTWAYFSIKRGARVTREPDHSGQAPFATPPAESPPPSAPMPATGPQGGNAAPASTASTASAPASGGVAAQ